MKNKSKKRLKFWFYLKWSSITLLGIVFLFLICIGMRPPSHDRDWFVGHKVMPYGVVEGEQVTVHNIRNNSWNDAWSANVSYFNETFNLSSMDEVWFLVEFWVKWDAMAHTMFSFEYGDGQYLVMSVESRKEVGENFSAIKGAFRKYELIYVLGTERDLYPLRTDIYGDTLYMYPINTTSEQVQLLFLDVLNRVNELHENPEWYHTLTSSCTTNLIDHAERTSGRVDAGISRYLPGYSDKVAYDLGLIDTDLPFEEIRVHYNITDASTFYAEDPDFSEKIRDVIESLKK